VWRKGGIYELWGELCESSEKLRESAESHEGYYIRQVWNQAGTNSLINFGSLSEISYCGAVQMYVVEMSVLYLPYFIKRKLLEGLWEILRCFGYTLVSLHSIFSLCFFGFSLLYGVCNWALLSCIVHYVILILQFMGCWFFFSFHK